MARVGMRNGRWFPRQKDAFDYVSTVDSSDTFVVAFDKKAKARHKNNNTADGIPAKTHEKRPDTIVKTYGVYKKASDYFADIMSVSSQTRNGYELIRADRPCALYIDAEWVGAHDPEHDFIKLVCKRIEEECERVGCIAAPVRFCVLCSSRCLDSADRFKNSYHILCPSLVFDNNHDGTMKSFVEMVGYADRIDLKVYTRNRSLRTEFCCKIGSNVHFYRIDLSKLGITSIDADEDALVSVLPRRALSRVSADVIHGCRKHGRPLPAADNPLRKRLCKHMNDTAGTCATSERLDALKSTAVSTVFTGMLPRHFQDCFVSSTTVLKTIVLSGPLPCLVRADLESGKISEAHVQTLYIENPGTCVVAHILNRKHAHSSNNALCVVANGRVFVKCFGVSCSKSLSFIRRPHGSYGEMPPYKDTVKMVIESRYGASSVVDMHDRLRIKQLYNLNEDARSATFARDPHLKILWNTYLGYGDWWLVPCQHKSVFERNTLQSQPETSATSG